MRQLFTTVAQNVQAWAPDPARHIYVYWTLSGLLLGTAFQLSWTWPLYLPGLACFFIAWHYSYTLRKLTTGLFIATFLKATGASTLFLSTYPIETIPIEGAALQLTLIITFMLITALALTYGFVLVLVLWRLLWRRNRAEVLLLPIAWIVADLASSLGYSLIALGPGGSLNFHYSFGHLGYLLADFTILDPLIRVGGVFALTLLAVWSGVLIHAFLVPVRTNTERRRAVLATLVGGVALLIGGVMTTAGDTSANTPTIITINTDFSTEEMRDPVHYEQRTEEIITEVKTAARLEPDIIVLPEGVGLSFGFGGTLNTLAFLTELASTSPFILIDSAALPVEGEHTVLRAIIYDVGAQEVSFVDKQFLVPQGEYVPYFTRWILPYVTSPERAAAILGQAIIEPGPKRTYDTIATDIPPILFCFEAISPFAVRQLLTKQPSDTVIHISSHAWFHDSRTLDLALKRMLRVQAVWSGVEIVEARNG